MNSLKNCPPVLCRRLILTFLLCLFFLLFGIGYYLYAGDIIFLMLSAAMFICCLIRSITLYKLLQKENYHVVEGVCVRSSKGAFKKYRNILLLSENGDEIELKLGNIGNLITGKHYRFYFKPVKSLSFKSEYLQTACATDLFLGLEDMGGFPSEGTGAK